MKIDDGQQTRLRHAADEPRLSARPLSFRQSRISHHHLPHRSATRSSAVVPEPLELDEPLVKYEFIRMPDSTGFGDYTETGQVIPVKFKGKEGGYSHAMFLNDEPPIDGGRELWGFPKKLAQPEPERRKGYAGWHARLRSVRVATATMGYKHRALDSTPVAEAFAKRRIIC